MSARGKTIAMTVAGLGAGMLLLFWAFVEAAGGHGDYAVFAVASLPGLALACLGDPIAMVSMFALPPAQWAFLAFCAGRCVFEKKPAWAKGLVWTGFIYLAVAAIWLTMDGFHHGFSPVNSVSAAGLCTGAFLVVAGLILRKPVALKPPPANPNDGA